jgi:hypothetical protein
MSDASFTTAFTVPQSPAEAYTAINDVRAWWGEEIDGSTDLVGAEFTYRHEAIHRSTQRVTALVPDERVEWHVVEGYLSFTQDTAEWTGTDVVFEMARRDGRTEVRFTHIGLAPEIECFGTCSNAWAYLINTSLRGLITTGKGEPLVAQPV